jgi:uncharacterized protein (TIGR02145 family)
MVKKSIGIAAIAVFATTGFGLCNTYADEAEFDVAIRPYVEVSVPSATNLPLAPTASGTFGSTNITVRSSTSNIAGYILTMTSEKNYLEGDTAQINSVDTLSGRTEDVFRNRAEDMNKWGVSIGNTNSFNPIASSTQLINSDTASVGQDSVIYVGAKVDSSVAPGTYSTTIRFQAVAKIDDSPASVVGGDPTQPSPSYDPGNPSKSAWSGRSLGRSYEVYYADTLKKPMYVLDENNPKGYRYIRKNEVNSNIDRYFAIQDMSPQVCNNNVYDNSELQVIDLRDTKIYWIAKLKDGHCWMTQNLDLALSSKTPLTHETSDIGWGTDKRIMQWTPPDMKKIQSNGYIEGADSNYYNNEFYVYNEWYFKPNSYEVGDWYYNGGSLTGSCGDSYLKGGCNKFRKNIPYETNGTHGHVGNYYNWNAATAQDASYEYADITFTDVSQNPQNSVCPKGWRLPTISSDSHNVSGSTDEFTRLYSLYKLDTDIISYVDGSDRINYINTAEDTFSTFLLAPLYFTKTGKITYYQGNPSNTHIGFYWSSTVHPNHYTSYYNGASAAYGMILESSYMFTWDQYPRIDAFSVRCVAR